MLKETKPTRGNMFHSEVDIIVCIYCCCGRDHLIGLYDLDVEQVCECGVKFIVDCRITVIEL